MAARPLVIVICGVSGSGKTTIGRLLASQLGSTFLDADDFHPPANINKMARGEPLTDTDRAPWLDTLRALIDQAVSRSQTLVLACSALKGAYRTRLGIDQQTVRSVWLEGSMVLIGERLAARSDHFMPTTLLASQFEAAEPPTDGIRVAVDREPVALVGEISRRLGVESIRSDSTTH